MARPTKTQQPPEQSAPDATAATAATIAQYFMQAWQEQWQQLATQTPPAAMQGWAALQREWLKNLMPPGVAPQSSHEAPYHADTSQSAAVELATAALAAAEQCLELLKQCAARLDELAGRIDGLEHHKPAAKTVRAGAAKRPVTR